MLDYKTCVIVLLYILATDYELNDHIIFELTV